MFAFLEGDRTFSIAYGLITGGLCLAVAIPILWWVIPGHRRAFFGGAIDPHYRLQVGYGIFTMALAFTDIGCRAIPHGPLLFVHPTFFLLTLLVVATLGPRAIAVARTTAPH
jgi:hypothetical protein